jgi:hypothetical protein
MATSEHTLSRRQALAGLSLIGAAIPAVAASAASTVTQPSRAVWDAAVAKHRHLHAEHEAACAALNPAEERYYAERPKMPSGAAFLIGDTVEDYHARIIATKAEYERLDTECSLRTGHDEAVKVQWLACDASWKAMTDLIATPAPDVQAVVLKMELAMDHGREIEDLKPILVDLNRLLTTGRA